MVKYFLHGGAAQHQNLENDKYFKDILKSAQANPRILLVHFASSPERNETNIQKDTAQFDRVKGDRNIKYDEARQDSFLDQVKKADIVYFGGGTTVKLVDEMKKYHGLKESFEGKVVAGESAGMNFLAKYSYSKSGGGVIKCLGILPIKTIPHYSDEFEDAKTELEKVSPDLQTIALPEYKYFVYETK